MAPVVLVEEQTTDVSIQVEVFGIIGGHVMQVLRALQVDTLMVNGTTSPSLLMVQVEFFTLMDN